jgi:phage gpG-like protein
VATVGAPVEFKWFPDPIVVGDDFISASVVAEDLHAPLHSSIRFVIQNVQKHFREEGADVGGWAPWAVKGGAGPSGPYAETYTQPGGRVKKKLQRNLGLYRTISQPSRYAIVGSTLIYLPKAIKDKVHQEGSAARNIYARPYMGLDAEGEEIVVRQVWDKWMQYIASVATGRRAEGITFFTRRGQQIQQPRSTLGTFLPGATVVG